MDRYQAMATFIRVVETGSFSAAARQLGVGQPAVSKTIAQLEAHLQVSLIVRSTHGLTPTEAGRIFMNGRVTPFRKPTRRNWPPEVPGPVCQAVCVFRPQRHLRDCILSQNCPALWPSTLI